MASVSGAIYCDCHRPICTSTVLPELLACRIENTSEPMVAGGTGISGSYVQHCSLHLVSINAVCLDSNGPSQLIVPQMPKSAGVFALVQYARSDMRKEEAILLRKASTRQHSS